MYKCLTFDSCKKVNKSIGFYFCWDIPQHVINNLKVKCYHFLKSKDESEISLDLSFIVKMKLKMNDDEYNPL